MNRRHAAARMFMVSVPLAVAYLPITAEDQREEGRFVAHSDEVQGVNQEQLTDDLVLSPCPDENDYRVGPH